MNALALFPDASSDRVWIHDQLAGLLALVAEHVPELQVTPRDLSGLVPAEAARTRWTAASAGSHCPTRERSDRLVSELEAADLLVIGAPIGHNTGTPALAEWFRRTKTSKAYGAPLYAMGLDPNLQAWFTHVIRADRTFRYTAEGPRGLLAGKKALVLAAQTGPWCRDEVIDHRVHCIHTQLRFMGIDDIATVASDRGSNPADHPRHWKPQSPQRLAA
jgi:FMN-dependent NADH-azoreductase